MALKLFVFLALGIAWSGANGASVTGDIHDLPLLRPNNLGRSLFYPSWPKPTNETDKAYWLNAAAKAIRDRGPKAQLNLNRAKNLILFLGDGMSISTVTAARILKGQREGRTGEESVLAFEKFPYSGLSKTYCVDSQVADSACTATAYLCGVKSNIMTIGVNAKVTLNDCKASMDRENHVSSLISWAQAEKKSTAIVTTTTLTHASPSGAYAHVANRLWECDTDVNKRGIDPTKCMDIAQQLVTQSPGSNFDVMLGGGMGKFLPKTIVDSHGKRGERSDGKNLLTNWQARHPDGLVITNRAQLLAVNGSKTPPGRLMGVFDSGLMKFHSENNKTQPTFAEMTETAIRILSRNQNGFVGFFEGGLIDYGNHFNKPGISLDETIEFEKGILKALELTNREDTLIVVTADHGHPLSISGYPHRGNNILDLNELTPDANGIKYATLNYAVGPQQYLDSRGKRIDLTGRFGAPDFIFPSYINKSLGVHSGDDVGVWASGPYAHLFSGTMEQNFIPVAMAYAACLGDGPTMCDGT